MEEVKKAIYRYIKTLNKIESLKYKTKKSTLKLQNDLTYNYVSNLDNNNINYILKTERKILNFIY